MKTNLRSQLLTGIFVLISMVSFSQRHHHRTPAWVSEEGYWVVESNIHEPRAYTIRFYNNDNVMTGKSVVSGTALNIKKKKTKMQLKYLLEKSLQTWTAEKSNGGNPRLASRP